MIDNSFNLILDVDFSFQIPLADLPRNDNQIDCVYFQNEGHEQRVAIDQAGNGKLTPSLARALNLAAYSPMVLTVTNSGKLTVTSGDGQLANDVQMLATKYGVSNPHPTHYFTTAIEVAWYFLGRSEMSFSKLTLLLYLSYAHFLVLNNEPNERLFNVALVATINGPWCIDYELNSAIKRRGENSVIHKMDFECTGVHFDGKVQRTLDFIWATYGQFSYRQLKELALRDGVCEFAFNDLNAKASAQGFEISDVVLLQRYQKAPFFDKDNMPKDDCLNGDITDLFS